MDFIISAIFINYQSRTASNYGKPGNKDYGQVMDVLEAIVED
ncbi:MAG: hypothetical protein AB8B73_06590 [Ekhidna sp.]